MTLTTENMSMRDKVMAVLEDALRTIKTSRQFIAGLSADIQEAVEAELTEVQEIVKSMDDYVLMHKSHIEVQQVYDQASASHLTNGMLQVMCSDRMHDAELLAYRFKQEVLESNVPKVFNKMIKYLEAPKPEQTQPDPS